MAKGRMGKSIAQSHGRRLPITSETLMAKSTGRGLTETALREEIQKKAAFRGWWSTALADLNFELRKLPDCFSNWRNRKTAKHLLGQWKVEI